jgi:hypothetical protein
MFGTTPDSRRLLRNTGVVFTACLVLALSEATNVYAMRDGTWAFALAMTLPAWVFMTPSAPVIVWLTRRFFFGPRNWGRSALVHTLASFAFVLTHLSAMAVMYMILVPRADSYVERFPRVFMVCFRYLFYQEVLAYWAIIGICLVMHHSHLRTRLAEARLTALRSQLNPHFLFNSLNAVSALALRGERAAVAETIGRLGDLLRATLDGQAQEVPLSQEIAFVDDYIAIQRVRFADRLTMDKAIAPDTLRGLVPTMILQPIVENAVEHGLGTQRGPGAVHIRAVRQNGSLLIEVSDTGPGFPAADQSQGIGLANTRARLEELYGSQHRFECGNLPHGGAAVRIMIPFRQSAA